ncbi:membrane protein, partial [mine drainage metagenome]
MDTPTLIKIEAKKNAFLAVLVCFIIALMIIGYLVFVGAFKLNDVIIEITALGILCVVAVIPTAYFNTIVNGYNYLYSAESYPNPNYKGTLNAITKDKAIIPYSFFSRNNNFRIIYNDGLYSYLYGFPNAALPTVVRCLEVGIKEKYKLLKEQINSASLS